MKKYIFILMLILVPALSHAIELGTIRINGFLSQGYLKTDENNVFFTESKRGTIEFNEVAVTLNAQITDKHRFGIQTISRDLGDIGNNEVTIDWALVDYRFANWLGLRVGKMKRPNGLYTQIWDVEAAKPMIFMPIPMYNENQRETNLAGQGFGLYGLLPGGIEYSFMYSVMPANDEGATIKSINEGAAADYYGEGSDLKFKARPSAQVFWNTPLDGLKLGTGGFRYDLSIQTAGNPDIPPAFGGPVPPSTLQIKGYRYTASLEYTWNDLIFASEYIGGKDKSRDRTGGRDLAKYDVEGYYGMLTYRFADLLEMSTAYSEWYPNKDNKDNYNYTKDITLAARFDLTDNWLLKMEVHHIKGIADVDATTVDVEDKWYMFAAKFCFSF